MNQDQVNAAIAEMNAVIQSLMQRCVNMAVELATVKAENASLKAAAAKDTPETI